MNSRTYNYIVNACIAVGVVSAFLFDRAGKFQWLVGSLAVLAGIVAAFAFFYDKFHKEQEQCDAATPQKETSVVANSPQVTSLAPTADVRAIRERALPKHIEAWNPIAWNPIVVWDLQGKFHYNNQDCNDLSNIWGKDGYDLRAAYRQQFFLAHTRQWDDVRTRVADEVEKMYIPGDAISLEMVVTKEDGERSVMFVVHPPASNRGKLHREELPYLTTKTAQNTPAWVDAASAVVA